MVLDSNVAKEWEVYMGEIVEKKLIDDFVDVWNDVNGHSTLELKSAQYVGDFDYIIKLVNSIVKNRVFEKGSIY